MEVDGGKASQINIVRAAPSLTIKGLAGPFAIMGQNFAPGTSAADVESAMTPIGGEMVSCKLIKSQPFVLMEMVFASREGGERVIETFNNQTVCWFLFNLLNRIKTNVIIRPTDESSRSIPRLAATLRLPRPRHKRHPPAAARSLTALTASQRTARWSRLVTRDLDQGTCSAIRSWANTAGEADAEDAAEAVRKRNGQTNCNVNASSFWLGRLF